MRDLFIELYLDEDVDVLLAELVKARGFAAVTTRDAEQLGASDVEQLMHATARGKVLLTHNRIDFENLAREWFLAGRSHSGIIVAARRPVHEILRRLLMILNHVAVDEIQNQIRYI